MTENFKPNLKQQEAIDCINGPVMLLAGPGTGKTFTLIKRVEKMLSSGIKPENILCLTFSDAATNEMKTRLVEKIGTEAIGVNVSTYHGFCMEIIRQYRADFEIAENVQMADDVTKQAILKESIEEFGEI
ncbi:MAG: UvrD-helicase domain-containing protein, partial [bacterium]|nr:UvrD-helicase domain-containing protein [bacterium]